MNSVMADEFEDGLPEVAIAPVSLPSDSRIPDAAQEVSDTEEYDFYFCLQRDNLRLLEWSRTCLNIAEGQLSELDQANLSAEEKYEIVKGLLLIHQVTLGRWVAAGEAVKGDERTDR